MRIVAMLFVVLGVVLAGGAIYYGDRYISNMEAMMARQDKGQDTVIIMVAKRRLKYGDRITGSVLSKTLRRVEWPANAVPKGAFKGDDLEGLLGPDKKQSRIVLRTIEAGEPILMTKLSGFGASSRVATRVSEGMRAFTIPINAVSGVGGLIAPGDRVDILLTRTISRQLTTSVILQNILVIATDRLTNTETDRTRVASTATVEVNPTDAQKLALAQQVGRLTLTLRGMAEPTEAESAPIQVGDLPDQPERAAPRQQGTSVKVRKGGKVQEIQVD